MDGADVSEDGKSLSIRCHGGPLDGTYVTVPNPPMWNLRARWPSTPIVDFISSAGPRLLMDAAPEAVYDLEVGRDWDGWPVYRYVCPQLTDPRGTEAPGYVKTRGDIARERVLAEVAEIHARQKAQEEALQEALDRLAQWASDA